MSGVLRISLLFVLLSLLAVVSRAEEKAAPEERAAQAVTQAAAEHRLEIRLDGSTFSGPGYERLVAEGRAADFFLIGEEHGIAENPQLTAQLFTALAPDGYRRLVIEISPPMATLLDRVLASGGMDGLQDFYAREGHTPAFFGMREESEMLAAVRTAVPPDEPALWGVDYEVAGDLALLRRLEALSVPDEAKSAVAALVASSANGWARLAETGDPRNLDSFTGDPQGIRDAKALWPGRGDEAAAILDALEKTLEINQLWMSGDNYGSNASRAANFRNNFLDHWRKAEALGEPPRVMAKLGANHLVRGRNNTRTFDLGSLLPELAAINGGKTFSVMVVPGKGAATAVLNPSKWVYEAAPPKDNYLEGLDPLLAAADPEVFTLIDLRPLRAVAAPRTRNLSTPLVRTVFGFDMILIMSGSTPSAGFPGR